MKYNSKILSLMTTLIFAFSLVLVSATATYAVDPKSNDKFTPSPFNGGGLAGNSQTSKSNQGGTKNQDNTEKQSNAGNQGSTGSNGNTGSDASKAPDEITSKLNEINKVLFTAACIICVIKAVQIGIMFMLNGAGSKGQAKSAILPWMIGAAVCGGYAVISNKIINLIKKDAGKGGVLEPGDPTAVVNSLGGTILSIMMYIAYATAFVVVILIGIKYMTGATGDKAKVKSTFVPYLIGAIIVGLSSQIAIYFMSIVGNG